LCIARGLFDTSMLNSIHDAMHKAVIQAGGRIEAIFFCPHAADANCDCRKPMPGMLREIERRMNIPIAGVPFVGDSLRDMQAAATVGARPVLVLTGKGRKTREAGGLPESTEVYPDLAAFAAHLAENREQRAAC
jgi:D-glycero-D-manno-heptose 1,7-bisphosphate phosphatase